MKKVKSEFKIIGYSKYIITKDKEVHRIAYLSESGRNIKRRQLNEIDHQGHIHYNLVADNGRSSLVRIKSLKDNGLLIPHIEVFK